MPALLTHFIFGARIADEMPSDLLKTSEELNAFLLGNQGADPFLARHLTWPNHAIACNRLHRRMHASHITDVFLAVREGVAYLPEADRAAGEAFALGLLCHYALDRTVHPFVYAQQDALVDVDPSLACSYHELHSIIETDLDSWLLWHQMRTTVEEFYPASALEADSSTCRVAGALFSQVALSVFGLNVGADEYEKAIADYARIYHAIEKTDPTYTTKLPEVLYKTEMFVRPSSSSYVAAMCHRVIRTDDIAAANPKRLPWKDPATGKSRTESFSDLMDEAAGLYHKLAHAFIHNDRMKMEEIVAGINYYGKPVTDLLDEQD